MRYVFVSPDMFRQWKHTEEVDILGYARLNVALVLVRSTFLSEQKTQQSRAEPGAAVVCMHYRQDVG